MKRQLLLVLIILLTLAGCSSGATETKIAKQYLKEQGYKILSHDSSRDPYILDRWYLLNDMSTWMVQDINHEQYLGKEVYVESFTVKNHPLDNLDYTHIRPDSPKTLGKTGVSVKIVDGKVIGGVSKPIREVEFFGGSWSLDGRKYEELYSDKNWREEADKWIEKYSKK